MTKKTKLFASYLTLDIHEKLLTLGGSAWVRKMVADADLSTRVDPRRCPESPYNLSALNDDERYLYGRLMQIKRQEKDDNKILLAPEWRGNFNHFKDYVIENIGPKPSPSHALLMVNKSGCYEPGNVTWGFSKRHTSTYELPLIGHHNLRFSIRGSNLLLTIQLPYPDGYGSTKLKPTSIKLATKKKSKNLTQQDIDSAIKRALSLINIAEQKRLAQDYQCLLQMHKNPVGFDVDTNNISIPFKVDIACLIRAIMKNDA